MSDLSSVLETHIADGPGYQPLVFSSGWQAAILNWEPPMDPGRLSEIERHARTDEVFVLWRGRAALVLEAPGGLHVVELQPGVVYNVRAGAWHTLVANRAASLVIVEDRDTHLHDTELRPLQAAERRQALAQLPEWATHGEGAG